jgi:hypothetical protein
LTLHGSCAKQHLTYVDKSYKLCFYFLISIDVKGSIAYNLRPLI